MKFVSLFLCTLLVLVLTGCGHNVATHSKGWGIDISWQQDSFVPNLRLGYWDVSYVMVKENTEVKMKSNAGLSANAGNSNQGTGSEVKSPGSSLSSNAGGNASNEIEIKTGPQINGYTKEVLTSPNFKKENVNAIQDFLNKESKK